MIFRPHMTSPELNALLADPYSPVWDFEQAANELIRRAYAAEGVANQPVRVTAGRRTVDEEDADVEGDRYEDDYWRRGETA